MFCLVFAFFLCDVSPAEWHRDNGGGEPQIDGWPTLPAQAAEEDPAQRPHLHREALPALLREMSEDPDAATAAAATAAETDVDRPEFDRNFAATSTAE